MPTLSRTMTPLGSWLRGLLARAHGNAVVVALAAKLARVAWSLLRHETEFAVARPPRRNGASFRPEPGAGGWSRSAVGGREMA